MRIDVSRRQRLNFPRFVVVYGMWSGVLPSPLCEIACSFHRFSRSRSLRRRSSRRCERGTTMTMTTVMIRHRPTRSMAQTTSVPTVLSVRSLCRMRSPWERSCPIFGRFRPMSLSRPTRRRVPSASRVPSLLALHRRFFSHWSGSHCDDVPDVRAGGVRVGPRACGDRPRAAQRHHIR